MSDAMHWKSLQPGYRRGLRERVRVKKRKTDKCPYNREPGAESECWVCGLGIKRDLRGKGCPYFIAYSTVNRIRTQLRDHAQQGGKE